MTKARIAMSLSLWPPNPLPLVDIAILIVVAIGGVLAVRRFIYDMRHSRQPNVPLTPPVPPTRSQP